MERKETSEEVLQNLIAYITDSLAEGNDPELMRSERIMGMRTAYVECLEIIQRWDKAEENGLDWDIEENYPV